MTMGKKVRGLILGLAAFSASAWLSEEAIAAGRTLTKEDVLTIKVVSQPDMDTTTRVGPDGTIEFPYVGRIKAAGLSEDQLARAIEQRLASRQIVTDPHVLIETTGFGTQATIQGQVGAPALSRLIAPRRSRSFWPGPGGCATLRARSSSDETAGLSDVTTARTLRPAKLMRTTF